MTPVSGRSSSPPSSVSEESANATDCNRPVSPAPAAGPQPVQLKKKKNKRKKKNKKKNKNNEKSQEEVAEVHDLAVAPLEPVGLVDVPEPTLELQHEHEKFHRDMEADMVRIRQGTNDPELIAECNSVYANSKACVAGELCGFYDDTSSEDEDFGPYHETEWSPDHVPMHPDSEEFRLFTKAVHNFQRNYDATARSACCAVVVITGVLPILTAPIGDKLNLSNDKGTPCVVEAPSHGVSVPQCTPVRKVSPKRKNTPVNPADIRNETPTQGTAFVPLPPPALRPVPRARAPQLRMGRARGRWKWLCAVMIIFVALFTAFGNPTVSTTCTDVSVYVPPCTDVVVYVPPCTDLAVWEPPCTDISVYIPTETDSLENNGPRIDPESFDSNANDTNEEQGHDYEDSEKGQRTWGKIWKATAEYMKRVLKDANSQAKKATTAVSTIVHERVVQPIHDFFYPPPPKRESKAYN